MIKLKKANLLICDYCGWKVTCRNLSDLKIHKIQDDKFRCPQCGRLIKLRLIEDTHNKLKNEMNNTERKEQFEQWIKENFQE